MALVSASLHLLVRSKKGAKFVPCKCTGMVKVVAHTSVCWNILIAFLLTVKRNRMKF